MRSWTKLSLKVDKNRHRRSLYALASVCTTYFRRLFECAWKQEREGGERGQCISLNLSRLSYILLVLYSLPTIGYWSTQTLLLEPTMHTHTHTHTYTLQVLLRPVPKETQQSTYITLWHYIIASIHLQWTSYTITSSISYLRRNPPQYTVGRDVHTHTLCNWN